MTLEEFLSELETITGWTVKNGYERYNLSPIRRYHDARWECPITAVCRKNKGMIFVEGDFISAGLSLGLGREDIIDIVNAADSSERNYKHLRQKLIKECRLEKK